MNSKLGPAGTSVGSVGASTWAAAAGWAAFNSTTLVAGRAGANQGCQNAESGSTKSGAGQPFFPWVWLLRLSSRGKASCNTAAAYTTSNASVAELEDNPRLDALLLDDVRGKVQVRDIDFDGNQHLQHNRLEAGSGPRMGSATDLVKTSHFWKQALAPGKCHAAKPVIARRA